MTDHPRAPDPHDKSVVPGEFPSAVRRTSLDAAREPSFADALAAVEQASDLPEQRRRHWACSLRQIAKALNRPPEAIEARWRAVKNPVAQLQHARVGLSAKTMANHRANAKAVLLWFRREHHLPQHGAPLTRPWEDFLKRIPDARLRQRLYNFCRYCSAHGILPADVDDKLITDYWAYRVAIGMRTTNNTARRFMVRAWNTAAGAMKDMRLQILAEPPLKLTASPPWEDFPKGLRDDLDRYYDGLAKPHRSLRGKRLRPCSAGTIATGRRQIMAAVRTAVRAGIPVHSLTSLAALLNPDVAERILNAYWKDDEPSTGTIDLAWMLFRMARSTGCLDQLALERLEEMCAALDEHRREGMTPKNLAVIRQVLTEGVWNEVVSLPQALMRRARSMMDHAPIRAGVTAQLAVAIAILSFAPVRLGNLVSIDLDRNLIKPGGLNTPYWLVFPHYDVKNRVELNFKFDEVRTALIDEYIHEFRPALLRGKISAWLFPGENGQAKNSLLFGQQITVRIRKVLGIRVTPHQFRHAAAAIYLKHHPGDYETVRRLLGHRDIQTTIRFYCALEGIAANEEFGKLIRERIEFDNDDDA